MGATLGEALGLLWTLDAQVLKIVHLSLQVSLSALLIGTLIGLPLGAWLAIQPFHGRSAVVVVLNTLMGFPSVIVGVLVYLLLSRSGPLGEWGLLFSPTAMIIAQSLLATPLIASISRQVVADAWREYAAEFSVFRIGRWQRVKLLLLDCRFSLLAGILAGLGRTMSEVGAVMIVGGNIEGYTRVMTTSIALETSKGDLALSIALGMVLLGLILCLNLLAHLLQAHLLRWGGS